MEVNTPDDNAIGWQFDHSYQQLPPVLFSKTSPTPVAQPRTVLLNIPLAADLGLNVGKENLDTITQMLSGNVIPFGADPIAQAYMGHQFGYPNMLGDGRAILLGEHITPLGARTDIQLKGPGITHYSRNGDGRATLYSMLREYIISEAMHHLGISTTRSLAVVATGQPVYREQINEGAVLTRIAASHIRVGTFEFATRHLPIEEFRSFLDYVINRHFPELIESSNPALDLLYAVLQQQADLIVQWMRVGFIHGVMNTDNMSVAGETIDYGPCAFMNSYNPDTVFSSIDTKGRYAFGNQPFIAQWNLGVFASSLLPLIDDDIDIAIEKAKAAIQSFGALFANKWLAMMRKKLGLTNELADDKKLADDLLIWMQTNNADYTNTFYHLSVDKLPEIELYQDAAFKLWHERWKQRQLANELPEEAISLMRANNPGFIPRNHLVEEALQAATVGQDMSLIFQLLDVISKPYTYRDEFAGYQEPPETDGGYKTFCGT